MIKERTYTLDEIERETGFDKRTIAYYVQEELLPKVGRRGPRTRYPQTYLDRLLFIRTIRGLQDRGRLGNLTLGDIKEIFEGISPRRITDIVAGRAPLESVLPDQPVRAANRAMAPPRHRATAMKRTRGQPGNLPEPVASRPMELHDTEMAMFPSSLPPPEEDEDGALMLDVDSGRPVFELREIVGDSRDVSLGHEPPPSDPATVARLLSSLAEAVGSGARSRRGSSEHWTRARITPGMSISVRDLDEGDAPLLDRLALELRRLISRVE